jgi:fluoride ion exporter CrcB/FEX
MLSKIWVSLTGAISGHGRCCMSRLVLQRCAMLFDPDTFAPNIIGLFIAGLFAEPNCSKKLSLVSPSIRQLSLSGLLGSSVTSVTARVIHGRAEVEESG